VLERWVHLDFLVDQDLLALPAARDCLDRLGRQVAHQGPAHLETKDPLDLQGLLVLRVPRVRQDLVEVVVLPVHRVLQVSWDYLGVQVLLERPVVLAQLVRVEGPAHPGRLARPVPRDQPERLEDREVRDLLGPLVLLALVVCPEALAPRDSQEQAV